MSFMLPDDVNVYLYLSPCDMRKSINTLSILVKDTLDKNPSSGHLFLFRSRDKSKMKALYFSDNCFSLWYRKLDKGRFIFPKGKDGCIELTRDHFQWLLVSHQYQHTDNLEPKQYNAFY